MKESSIGCLVPDVNFSVVVYDIGMTQTGGLMGLIRRAYLLVETTGGARTADEVGIASSEALFQFLLQHMYLFFKTIRNLSNMFSLYKLF